MKLYATTTSERATKGQGGNHWLNVTILAGDDRAVMMELVVNYDKTPTQGRIKTPMKITAGDIDFLKVLKNNIAFYIDCQKENAEQLEHAANIANAK